MIESATGLVLRTRPLTETSLIVCWLTPQLGRFSTVAKGARRAKSAFRGKLDLFYLANFSFSRNRRSELHTLCEVELHETHGLLRQDLTRLQQAAYAALLVEQVTETETPLPGIYDLLLGLLAYLVTHPTQPGTIFAFELKLLSELGLQPDLEQARLTAGAKSVARHLTQSEWTALARLQIGVAQISELDRFLRAFLLHHLGRVPKGREAALAKGRSEESVGNP